ncbi:MAG: protein kinase [Gemmatimonadota bacterium]|nr:MAG: protein kinase [Gemmatimonadota bacterium]
MVVPVADRIEEAGSRSSTDRALVGRTVSHYRIDAELAQGGMGVVYLATDIRLDRTVAIKFLPARVLAHGNGTQRFIAEARAAAALDHPNICNIHEIRRDEEGRLFMVMAFYDGETLQAKLERGPVPLEEAVDYTAQIARGLEAAHEHGIVHRDIKPGNIIVTSDGVVKILDFGLAKLTDVTVTADGTRPGTVAYMSPEQSRGEPLDRRTDLWSLGVVLYEMVTGRRPFAGERRGALINAIRHDEPTPPAQLRAGLPSDLAELTLKLLHKDRGQRCQSAAAVLDALPPYSTRSKAAGEGILRVGRLQTLALAGAALLVAVLVALAASYLTVRTGWRGGEPPGVSLAGSESSRPVIALLACANLSPDPSDAYLAVGLQAELVLRLSEISTLTTIGRESVRLFREHPAPAQRVASTLGADFVVECSVRKEPGEEQVQFAFQVLDATGTEIWADSHTADPSVGGLQEMENYTAQEIARVIGVTLTAEEENRIAQRSTEHADAYELYLRGMLFAEGRDAVSLLAAEHLLQQAIALDSQFAAAHAQLSIVYSTLPLVGRPEDLLATRRDRSSERLELARQSAEVARSLDPTLADVHRALGRLHYAAGDYDGALQEASLALEARPDAQVFADVAVIHRRQGNLEESLRLQQLAEQLEPISYRVARDLAHTLTMLRRFPEAELQWKKAQRLAPDRIETYTGLSDLYLSWEGRAERADSVLQAAERAGLASPELEKARIELAILKRDYRVALDRLNASRLRPICSEIEYALRYARVHRLLGDEEKARAVLESVRGELETMVRENPEYHYVRWLLAQAYAGLGLQASAIREVERLVRMRPVEEDLVAGQLELRHKAIIYTEIGQTDTAIDQLKTLLSLPGFLTSSRLKIDPRWDSLRDHPRFQALLKSEGASS